MRKSESRKERSTSPTIYEMCMLCGFSESYWEWWIIRCLHTLRLLLHSIHATTDLVSQTATYAITIGSGKTGTTHSGVCAQRKDHFLPIGQCSIPTRRGSGPGHQSHRSHLMSSSSFASSRAYR